jgi:hypothetical protein
MGRNQKAKLSPILTVSMETVHQSHQDICVQKCEFIDDVIRNEDIGKFPSNNGLAFVEIFPCWQIGIALK